MQVDYYIREDAQPTARMQFCCRLLEKAVGEGYDAFVLTSDAASAAALDERLWTFSQGSFVPHALVDQADGEPVLIGTSLPERPGGLLVILGDALPEGWQHWSRVAEIVVQSPEVLTQTRERYRRYRDAGVAPQLHR